MYALNHNDSWEVSYWTKRCQKASFLGSSCQAQKNRFGAESLRKLHGHLADKLSM